MSDDHGTQKMIHKSCEKISASVIDIFCGAGGLSHGFFQEGFRIAAGIDIDEDCRYAFEQNNDAPFLRRDVSNLTSKDLDEIFFPDEPRVLVGCAPCQPFSLYNQKNSDPKWKLLKDFGDLISDVRPDVVSMENVAQLIKFRGGNLFSGFVKN